jgi:repressor LexA
VYLTKRQSELLDYLRKTIAVQGYAPSLEEMAEHFELSSVGTVHKHLKALEEKGVIRRQWNRSRAIEIVDMPDGKARRLPILGKLAAGKPIAARSGSESVAVPEDMLGRGSAYVLQVEGAGLISEHLMDGDLVVVEQRDTPRDGEVVVVLYDDNARVGKFEQQGERQILRHRDPARPVEVLIPERCKIHGVVLGVLRRMRASAGAAG